MKQAVICIVHTEEQADRIVEALRAAQFNADDVSMLLPNKNMSRDLGHETHSKGPEGVTTGVSVGAVLGGALGWLAGIGALAVPGLGPFIAAGPIMALLSGAAVGGSVGGVVGALVGLGLPEYEAKQYEGKLRDGNILLSVHTEDSQSAKRVEDIFKDNGATDIKKTGEQKVKTQR
ncbi:MAG: hypothetical protein C5B53_10145 [Candidatus Melainabacteria bacterium]|nr:MAG: hypothetical protein C5B53_10145 [Candidatus Melainabacteria bacterium]